MTPKSERATVAIVGFGPIGMSLAGLLGRRNVDVIAFDRALDVFPLPRAAHMDHTTLRTMQELNLVEDLLPQLVPNPALVLTDHALDPLVTIPAAKSSKSGYAASHYFYQPDFDRFLERSVSALPTVRVRRGVNIQSVQQDDDHAVLSGIDDDGNDVSIEAEWVIGCDGSKSLIRESMGTLLDSLGFDESWLVLDLFLGSAANDPPPYALQVCDPERAWVSNPVPGDRCRVEVRIGDVEDATGLQDETFLRGFLAPLLGDAEITIERNAVYAFHGLIADSWRSGRLLLAGDAAHQMPPFLGQGMVSGIRDAENLAWKLAGVIDGIYPTTLLDTYEAERAPHVRSITASAIEVGRFVSASDPEEVAKRNLRLRSGDTSDAPQFRLPNLEPGPFVGLGGGDVLPQPINHATGLPTLDDLLGDGIVILTAEPLEESDDLNWWRKTWDATELSLSDLDYAAEPVKAWLASRAAAVAVIRPDRYVLATGRSLREVTEDVRMRTRQLLESAW